MPCINAGYCCKLIIMPIDRLKFLVMLSNFKKEGNPDGEFIGRNWTEIMLEEALKIRPDLKINTSMALKSRMFFTCKQYNPEAKRCMDYINRPRVCSEYPYYGNKNKSPKEMAVYRKCGYLADHPDGAEFARQQEAKIKAFNKIEEICSSEN